MPYISINRAIPELTMGPCRDFGELSLEDFARLPIHTGVATHIKCLVEKLRADNAILPEDADHVQELANTLAIAPGYARFLSDDKKRHEARQLYDIVRRSSLSHHPLGRDLMLAFGIVLFSIDPSERLVSSLSRLESPEMSGPLAYEYHAMLALNFLLIGSLDKAASNANIALGEAPDDERQAYIKMLQACISLRSGDPGFAVQCLDDSLNGNERLNALISFYAGIVRFEHSEYDSALRCFEAAGASAKDILDALAVRCNVGACAVSMGDMESGEKEFDTVGRMVSKKNGPRALRRKLLADSYMGIISRARGEYSGAEKYYKKALKECLELNDKGGIANQLGNMGVLYLYTGDHPMALRLFNTCLLYSERIDYREGIRFSYANLCVALAETGQASEARKLKELYSSRYPGLDI